MCVRCMSYTFYTISAATGFGRETWLGMWGRELVNGGVQELLCRK